MVNKDEEVFIEGPPLEALRFQGGRVGSLVTLSDLQGNDFRGRVLSLSEEEASVLIFDLFLSPTESPLEIVLLQALPEKERMELIIQKATELGVSAIVPFKSERSISLEEREAKQRKAHRWQEIAVKAVQQSRRAKVPRVEAYRPFHDALIFCSPHPPSESSLPHPHPGPPLSEPEALPSRRPEGEGNRHPLFMTPPPSRGRPVLSEVEGSGGGWGICPSAPCLQRPQGIINQEESLRILLWEKNGEPLKDLLRRTHHRKIYAMVGPEGGFTKEEVRSGKDKGFIPIKLGQRILRTETAAITLIGILQYELGDLG